ncbi:MAG: peptide-N-glycosidase [Ignavibacteriae bacterium]|nr:peptide-N-glycosidase [Ignavibacteriota bacterium]
MGILKISKHFIKFAVLVLLMFSTVIAQQKINEGIVYYSFKNNGKISTNHFLKMFYKNGIVGYESGEYEKQKEFINYNDNFTYQLMNDGKNQFFQKRSFKDYEQAAISDETENILGYNCKKAVLKIKSNTIEIWFTNELKIKGSPSISIAPGIGLILKMVRNKDYETFAEKIEFKAVTEENLNFNLANAVEVNGSSYLRKLIDSRYKTIQIFEHQKINFGDSIDNPNTGSLNFTYRYSKGTVLLKKIKLPIINEGEVVFAEVSQWSNGDAYDRVGSLFIIPVKDDTTFLDALKFGIDKLPVYKDKNENEFQGVCATKNYEPPLELMRFFTPFGVRKFNDYTQIQGFEWADSVIYRRDVTDIIPNDGKEIWVGIFIGNYDKGGHIASVNLKIYPSFEPSDKLEKVWIKPIFNTVNIMEMSNQNYGTMFHNDSLRVTVNIPDGLKELKLKYTSTGHGGWENGDEFNRKKNEIFIDDKLVYSFIPWRDDCGTYRLSNPSSGNFKNGLSSSDLSRSNWCPGTVTVPEEIELNNLSPGYHTFKIAIPIGEKEGGSFSAWNVSGILIGKFK